MHGLRLRPWVKSVVEGIKGIYITPNNVMHAMNHNILSDQSTSTVAKSKKKGSQVLKLVFVTIVSEEKISLA